MPAFSICSPMRDKRCKIVRILFCCVRSALGENQFPAHENVIVTVSESAIYLSKSLKPIIQWIPTRLNCIKQTSSSEWVTQDKSIDQAPALPKLRHRTRRHQLNLHTHAQNTQTFHQTFGAQKKPLQLKSIRNIAEHGGAIARRRSRTDRRRE